ncbi:hypothetical protein BN7_4165 [Wickerhamomyces ciferrii]|uniref:NAD(P)-binding domain-containing protein n=1 Tax=Wickerhamomyces ciferrii (strain ATCC 14091 / BCRC 22168 / CBS 111 / JCM 3599 / NBRC 0793 / NRRL Y-1031 F-60-10) TaxID=1206466 RepID=K0KR70_WICCF|nr:uncharacterized protein BN7_4165 [Wickerhamomyces ciferrii]CCH44597.1 hypothetical protein BN7_4165 [Wickerhamomyces ciferrii]
MTEYYGAILITGGAGFLGAHFVNFMVQKYPQINFICIDKLNYASNIKFIKVFECSNFQFIEKDLSKISIKELITLFKSYKITQIINFAAESCVDKSFIDPLFFTQNNIISTQNLLECCRLQDRSNAIKFIHISTDEVYGEQLDNSKYVTEESKLNPTNPYAATKAAIDLIIQSYIYSYKIPITVIRSNNVYGIGQYPEKIVPVVLEVIRKRSSGENIYAKVPIHGSGKYKRTYLYTTDFIEAIELIWLKQLQGQLLGEIFNVGGDHNHNFEIENLDLVKLIMETYETISGNQCTDYIEFIKDRNYNDSRYLLDCSKMKSLGWEPKISLQEGITKIIKQYYHKD